MKHHLTDAGPKRCVAKTPDACRASFQGKDAPHFAEEGAARQAYEEALQQHLLPSPRRTPLPSVEVYPTLLKGGSYCGALVPAPALEDLRRRWLLLLGEEGPSLEAARHERDGGSASHVTLLSPQETRLLKKEGRLPSSFPSFPITPLGVGHVRQESDGKRGGSEAWFVVCSSPQVDEWRGTLGLPPKDLHVTLGFSPRDVHGVSKGEDTLVDLPR